MSDYWKNKKVLITGINGFVGGNLAKSLIEQGAEVFGLVRNENKRTFLYHEKLDAKIRLFFGRPV